MDTNLLKQVKALIANNDLEEALDLLINKGYMEGLERHNTLLLLRSRMTMLKEQELAGILDFDEIAKQKARIAHALLEICKEGSSAEVPPPVVPRQEESPKQVTNTVKPAWSIRKNYLIGAVAFIAVLALMYLVKNSVRKPDGSTVQHSQTEGSQTSDMPSQNPDYDTAVLHLEDFPLLKRQLNFSDMRYTFTDVSVQKVTAYSSQYKLTLKFDFECRSNLGKCHREAIRILVDGKPVAPFHRVSQTDVIRKNVMSHDELTFLIDAGAKEYGIKLSKNGSDWYRNFEILH